MRPLVLATASSRYAAVQRLELEAAGCIPLAPRLWRAPKKADLIGTASIELVLAVLARALTFNSLLELLANEGLRTDAPWRLRYESLLSHSVRDDASIRQSDRLCAIARYLTAPPALRSTSEQAVELVVLRTSRLWYIASVVESPMLTRARHIDVWRSRPYSFSAATDPILARLVLSAAYRAYRGPSQSPGVFDPCCGSGTLLFAAAQRGLPSWGCDLNPLATRGARANLAHAAQQLSWPSVVAPAVYTHDSSNGLPAALRTHTDVELVVANLPWGREQRIPSERYLEGLLLTVRTHLPDANVYCLLTATSLRRMLPAIGLHLEAEVDVGGDGGRGRVRCVLTIARTDGPPPNECSPMPLPTDAVTRAVDGTSGSGIPTASAVLLSGGGLRASPDASVARCLPPAAGDTISLQYRDPGRGRRWVPAEIKAAEELGSAAEGSVGAAAPSWLCTLVRLDEDAQTHCIPSQLRLAQHDGPNWRFETRS